MNETLGLKLITTLVNQIDGIIELNRIDGIIELNRIGGTMFIITFRNERT